MILAGAGVVTTFSKEVTSLGEAKSFNCFPKLRMVSWHSASFSDAAEICQSCKRNSNECQSLNTQVDKCITHVQVPMETYIKKKKQH